MLAAGLADVLVGDPDPPVGPGPQTISSISSACCSSTVDWPSRRPRTSWIRAASESRTRSSSSTDRTRGPRAPATSKSIPLRGNAEPTRGRELELHRGDLTAQVGARGALVVLVEVRRVQIGSASRCGAYGAPSRNQVLVGRCTRQARCSSNSCGNLGLLYACRVPPSLRAEALARHPQSLLEGDVGHSTHPDRDQHHPARSPPHPTPSAVRSNRIPSGRCSSAITIVPSEAATRALRILHLEGAPEADRPIDAVGVEALAPRRRPPRRRSSARRRRDCGLLKRPSWIRSKISSSIGVRVVSGSSPM